MLSKARASRMRRGVSVILPDVRTELRRVEHPLRAWALRVSVPVYLAIDFAVQGDVWVTWSSDHTGFDDVVTTGIPSTAGPEVTSAEVAGRVLAALRPHFLPPNGKPDPADHGAFAAYRLFCEVTRYLAAVASGQIPFTEAAKDVAAAHLRDFDDALHQSRARADTRESRGYWVDERPRG